MELNLTIGPHPAVASHPTRRKEKLTIDGKPVPLLPEHRSVRIDGIDGRVIAYVSSPKEGRNLSFIIPAARLGPVVMEEARKLVEKELGPIGKVASPPEPQPDEPEEEVE